MGDEEKYTKLIASIEYNQTYNLGNYQSEKITIRIEGPFNDIKDGKDLPRLLLFTATNMKKLTDKVHEGVDPTKYEKGSEQVKVEKLVKGKVVEEGKETKGKKEIKKIETPAKSEQEDDI